MNIIEIDDNEINPVINGLARSAGELNQRLIELGKQADQVIKREPNKNQRNQQTYGMIYGCVNRFSSDVKMQKGY